MNNQRKELKKIKANNIETNIKHKKYVLKQEVKIYIESVK